MRLDTVYVSIGNSDDSLTQSDWANFWGDVNSAAEHYGGQIYGVWLSVPNSMFQNACWAFGVKPEELEQLKQELRTLAGRYDQDSIAFFEGTTTFLTPETADALTVAGETHRTTEEK